MRNYKYNVNINQYAVVEHGLDLDIIDMFIFDFMAGMFQLPQRVSITADDGTEYVCISNEFILQQLPMLKVNKRNLTRRINKLVRAELLIRHVKHNNKTYYCTGKKFNLTTASTKTTPSVDNDALHSQQRLTPQSLATDNNIITYNDTTDNDTTNNISGRKAKRSAFVPPTQQEVEQYVSEQGLMVDAGKFVDFYEARGWQLGKTKMKDWKAAARNWNRNNTQNTNNNGTTRNYFGPSDGRPTREERRQQNENLFRRYIYGD